MSNMIVALMVTNTLVNLVVVFLFAKSIVRRHFHLTWNETFWKRRKYGVTLWKQETKYISRKVFYVNWTRKLVADEWDTQQYKKHKGGDSSH